MLQNYLLRFLKIKKPFSEKMERFSPLFVYGHDADVCHKITAPALRFKPATSTLWANFRETRTGCVFRIRLYARIQYVWHPTPNSRMLLSTQLCSQPQRFNTFRSHSQCIAPKSNEGSGEVRPLWAWPTSLSESQREKSEIFHRHSLHLLPLSKLHGF